MDQPQPELDLEELASRLRYKKRGISYRRQLVATNSWIDSFSAAPEPPRPSLIDKLLPHKPAWLYAMAGIVFVVGLIISLMGALTNHSVAQQVNRLQKQSSPATNNTNNRDVPSTVKPSAYSITNYQVAPDLPRYIDIPVLNVHARVLQVGVKPDGSLDTPRNVYDTAWYNASAKPGQAGAMLIDGHISSWTAHGVFYGLGQLKSGDKITITRGDGVKFTYLVAGSKTYDARKVDMPSLLLSKNANKPGLNLISCAGDVIPGTNEFNQRIAIFAVEQ